MEPADVAQGLFAALTYGFSSAPITVRREVICLRPIYSTSFCWAGRPVTPEGVCCPYALNWWAIAIESAANPSTKQSTNEAGTNTTTIVVYGKAV